MGKNCFQICVVLVFLATLVATVAFFILCIGSKHEVDRLKSKQRDFGNRTASSPELDISEEKEKTTNLNSETTLEQIAQEIKQEELKTSFYTAASIIFALITFFGPIVCCLSREFCVEYFRSIRVRSSNLFRRTQAIDNRIAWAIRATRDPAAPISVVHRRARDTEDDAVQGISADLPGVPSTSNN